MAEKFERCRAMVFASQPELVPEDVEAPLAAERNRLRTSRHAGWRRSHAELPVFQTAGPLQAIVYGMGLSLRSLLRSVYRVWADAIEGDDRRMSCDWFAVRVAVHVFNDSSCSARSQAV